jgi:PTH1 family peptidyl-tRNA hydrolase
VKRFLITGLGNPGAEYDETRHNVGFKVLDELAVSSSTSFFTTRHGHMAEVSIKGRRLYLLKPNTFMNLSGKAVRYHLQDLKLNVDQSLVIADDISLPFGKIRLRGKGSDGGHNGLKSVIQELGSSAFPRLRFGIGDAFHKGKQIDYVLGPWSEEEQQGLGALLTQSTDCVRSFVLEGLSQAMNKYN